MVGAGWWCGLGERPGGDGVVYLGHQADGHLQRGDDAPVVLDVVVCKGATAPILEPRSRQRAQSWVESSAIRQFFPCATVSS